jgi:hypothetical protein
MMLAGDSRCQCHSQLQLCVPLVTTWWLLLMTLSRSDSADPRAGSVIAYHWAAGSWRQVGIEPSGGRPDRSSHGS